MQAIRPGRPGHSRIRSFTAALFLPFLAGACAQWTELAEPDSKASCVTLLTAFDAAVAEAEVGWSGAGRVNDFPYLRVDRFLASYRQAPLSDAALASWTEKMRSLDSEGRGYELARLPAASVQNLDTGPDDLQQRMEVCAEQLRAADLGRPERIGALREAAVVADDYSLAQRTFGLYPLTFMPVSEGVYRLQREIRADFATDPAKLAQVGRLVRYIPPTEPGAAELPVIQRFDPMGVPALSDAELEALFAIHAPVWEIDTLGDYDKPGVPYWQGPDSPAVQSGHPVSYRYHSWTRWNQRALLQLNYIIWFDERPPRSSNDLLSGRLDGLVWRVTLRADGRPLIYDSMHPCGCYHMFFPESSLRLKVPLRRAPEPPLVPAPAPTWEARSRVVLRLASGSHYLQAVYRDPALTGETYGFRDYSELYAIAAPGGGARGLFSPDGLVAGSERAERWVLWPMGVVSPGAMRGRGHHATAFIGRRHFDDPHLIESVFDSTTAPSSPI